MTAPAQVLPTTLGTCAREGRPVAWADRGRGSPCCTGCLRWRGSQSVGSFVAEPHARAAGTQSRPGPHHRGDPGMRLPAGQRYQAVVHGSNITRDMLSRLPRDYCL